MKYITTITKLLTLVTVLSLSSCASIIHGSKQQIHITSQPSTAKITIDGQHFGNTPNIVTLPRKGRLPGQPAGKVAYEVKIELEGFYPHQTILARDVDGWLFGNILFGGLLGIIIDAASGSMYRLTPNQIQAQMNRTSSLKKVSSSDLYVAVTLTPDPSWEKIGTLKKLD